MYILFLFTHKKEKIKYDKLFSSRQVPYTRFHDFLSYCNYCNFSLTFNATVKLTIRTDVGVEEENR